MNKPEPEPRAHPASRLSPQTPTNTHISSTFPPHFLVSPHFPFHSPLNSNIWGSRESKAREEKRVWSTKAAAVYENLQLCRGSLRRAGRRDWSRGGHVDSSNGNLFPTRLHPQLLFSTAHPLNSCNTTFFSEPLLTTRAWKCCRSSCSCTCAKKKKKKVG